MASSNPNRRGGFRARQPRPPPTRTPAAPHSAQGGAGLPAQSSIMIIGPSLIFLRLTLWCPSPKSPTIQALTLLRLNFRSSSSPLPLPSSDWSLNICVTIWGGGCCGSDSFSLGDTPLLGSVSSPAQPTRNPRCAPAKTMGNASLPKGWRSRFTSWPLKRGLPPRLPPQPPPHYRLRPQFRSQPCRKSLAVPQAVPPAPAAPCSHWAEF